MPPLPAGFVDIGTRASYVLNGNLSLKMKATRNIQLGEGQLTVVAGDPGKLYAALGLSFLPFVGSRVVETFDPTDPGPGVAGPLSGLYTYTERAGPFRVGASLDSTGPTDIERQGLRYGLFYDEETVWSYNFGGLTGTRTGLPLNGPLGLWLFPLAASTQFDATNTEEFFWTGLQFGEDVVDTSQLDDGIGKGFGSGSIQVANNAPFRIGRSSIFYSFGPAQQFALDVAVSDYEGHPLNVAFQIAGFPETLTTPYTGTRSLTVASWTPQGLPLALLGQEVRLQITDDWLTSHGLPAQQNNVIPILGVPPHLPLLPPQSYKPAAITLTSRLPVLLSANPWQPVDAAKASVSGSSFTISQAGGEVFRTLKSNWQAWVGLATGGKSNAEFGTDRYRITKHDALPGSANAGQDVWAWGTYAFLQIKLHAAAAGTGTLAVTGQKISVFDSHSSDAASRKAALTVVPSNYIVTYPFSVSEGENSIVIDLLFPKEGGPFAPGRVTQVKLSGLAVGGYTLSGFDLLASRERGDPHEDAYLKIDWDRGDGGVMTDLLHDRGVLGVHASLDGSEALGVADVFQKKEELRGEGGALRLRDAVVTGTQLQSNEKTLPAFLQEWNQIEGWQVTYDAAASDLALKDSDGNRLLEVSTFLPQLVPHQRITPGTEFRPECAIRCGSLTPANLLTGARGTPWPVYARYRMGAALEAQSVTPAGKRGPAGKPVFAVRADTSARVGQSVTDTLGYVAVSVPLPPGTVDYRLESDT